LRSLGYKHFLVYEKEPKAGGRVYTNTDLGTPVELGTVFTTNAATVTLGYADQYGVPYVERPLSTSILDDDGTVLSREAFAARKYACLM
jgi:monoamine oxidase